MADVTMTLEEYEALRRLITSERESEGAVEEAKATRPKRRRVSKYSREFGRQLKKLKKKHPRTKITALMSRAHRATRKVMK
jgi:hypothetical protein